jgi:gentisate 1,2-dioxygenase
LDFPLMEFLDCVWLDDEFAGGAGDSVPVQPAVQAAEYSRRLYGSGGMIPGFVTHQRGFGRKTSPMIHYRGVDIRSALEQLRSEAGDGYEAIALKFVNPATGAPVFPTLDYSAQLLRGGEETRFKRETSATLYVVMEGSGATEIAGQRFNWETNDVFVVPSFLWRRHLNRGKNDAVLYAVSDQPLMEKIGQYRAQGRTPEGAVVELC